MQPQQAPMPNYAYAPGKWTTGLCGCCEYPGNCCMTCWCPCITFGRNAEIIDRDTVSCIRAGAVYCVLAFVGCSCIYSCLYRKNLRAQFSLPEEPCGDFCVHCCCNYCAICQEYRELKNRGLDPSVGWMANAQKMNQGGVAMGPPVMQSMPR